MPTDPKWISGRKLYEISGPDNSALGCHFSGLLRQMSDMLGDSSNTVIDENQNEYELATVLWETAERLDDAHEEWLGNQLLYGTPS